MIRNSHQTIAFRQSGFLIFPLFLLSIHVLLLKSRSYIEEPETHGLSFTVLIKGTMNRKQSDFVVFVFGLK